MCLQVSLLISNFNIEINLTAIYYFAGIRQERLQPSDSTYLCEINN